MSGARILVVDDEMPIRRLLRGALERAGYRVFEAEDGRGALRALDRDAPDAVLLDLGLPDRDGLELVPLLKGRSPAALLVISAREATDDKVAALDLGADDYVTKPFDSDELLARIRAALRGRIAAQGGSSRVRAGDVEIDLVGHLVTRAGAEVHLTRKEHEVLAQPAWLRRAGATVRPSLEVWCSAADRRVAGATAGHSKRSVAAVPSRSWAVRTVPPARTFTWWTWPG